MLIYFQHLRKILFCVVMAVSATFIISCNDDGTQDAASGENYSGPGSRWDVSLMDDNTFTITRSDDVGSPVTLTVNGNYERLASGFLKFTVTSATGTDAPSAGEEAWALEAPGYALFLVPLDENNDQVIPMVTSGECPTADFTANWVIVKKADDAQADDADRDFFGEFEYTAASQSARLPSRRALANNFQDGGDQSLSGGNCTLGIMEVEDAVMYLTVNGGAIVHTSVNDPSDASFIFGLTQKAITDIDNLDGNYSGILFDESLNDGSELAPVSLVCAAGVCTGNMVTDIDTGATSAESVTVNLSGTPDGLASGLVTGTIDNGGSGNLACMADVDVLGSGTRMISCVGQSPGDNTNMFNVLFVSSD